MITLNKPLNPTAIAKVPSLVHAVVSFGEFAILVVLALSSLPSNDFDFLTVYIL